MRFLIPSLLQSTPEPAAAKGSPAEPVSAVKYSISVVLPVYNHARYLAESVASVLAEPDLDLQLIVVDDGSSDFPEQAIEPFRNDLRLNFIQQENQGLSSALNRGFREASKELWTWTSADNAYEPGALSAMAEKLQRRPDLAMVYGNARLINDAGEPFRASDYRRPDQSPDDSSVLRLPANAESLASLNDNFIGACFLYRASVARQVGDYDVEKNGFEDYDYWLRISEIGKIERLEGEQAFYRYRLHSATMTEDLRDRDLFRLQLQTVFEAAKRSMEREIFPSEVGSSSFLHPEHAQYFRATPEPAEATPPLVLPGPLRFPGFFTRARTANYGAVRPEPSTQAILVFAPGQSESEQSLDCDWAAETLSTLLARSNSYTLVLLARNKTQRHFADRLNLSSGSSRCLRIVDISNENNSDWCPPSVEHFSQQPWQQKSMLYVLSSVSGILTLKYPEASLCSENELMVEAGLAAVAGIPMVWAVEQLGRSADLKKEFLSSSPQVFPCLSKHILRTLRDAMRFKADFPALDLWLQSKCSGRVRNPLPNC